MPYQWRDCQEWREEGLPLTTTSNEAAKLYDATLNQYVRWRSDPSVGGLVGSITGTIKADEKFVLGHTVACGLELIGMRHSPRNDPAFQTQLNNLFKLADATPELSPRERMHVDAIKHFSEGNLDKATWVWQDILLAHPTDMLAIKLCHDSYFYLGYQAPIRDSINRVLPHWKPTMPLAGYLHGILAFGHMETGAYSQAEAAARKGLSIDPEDGFASHNLAHVFEYTGQQNEGLAFLGGTENNWTKCDMLSGHNYWHMALYHVEKGDYEDALGIFDSQLSPRFNDSLSMLYATDACSLLKRLQIEGVNVGDRWDQIYEVCRSRIDDHMTVFNDLHIIMSCFGANHKETAQQLITSLEEFIREGRNGDSHSREVFKKLGLQLCQAFVAYEEGDFEKTVELMYRNRYDIQTIGGSNAQRDVFNLFLISAALKSPSKKHQCLARQLLIERKALKENSPMSDRLMAKALTVLGQ